MVSRGYAEKYLHYSRESGVFVLAVEKVFSARVDWHQDDRARPIVGQYLVALDSVLQAHPDLRPCVAHCARCGVGFLTHPRNAGRRNLRCPFGCRELHRRERSTQRSTAYYRTDAGKRKKQSHNRRRGQPATAENPAAGEGQPASSPAWHGATDAAVIVETSIPAAVPESELPQPLPQPPIDALPCRPELRLGGVVLDESTLTGSPLLPYLRMMVGLIEGLRFTIQELLDLLRKALRQHSIASRTRREYVLGFLRQHPP